MNSWRPSWSVFRRRMSRTREHGGAERIQATQHDAIRRQPITGRGSLHVTPASQSEASGGDDVTAARAPRHQQPMGGGRWRQFLETPGPWSHGHMQTLDRSPGTHDMIRTVL